MQTRNNMDINARKDEERVCMDKTRFCLQNNKRDEERGKTKKEIAGTERKFKEQRVHE